METGKTVVYNGLIAPSSGFYCLIMLNNWYAFKKEMAQMLSPVKGIQQLFTLAYSWRIYTEELFEKKC